MCNKGECDEITSKNNKGFTDKKYNQIPYTVRIFNL